MATSHFVWREQTEVDGVLRLLVPWSDPMVYEHPFDYLFDSEEEARERKEEIAPEEDWVLYVETLERVGGHRPVERSRQAWRESEARRMMQERLQRVLERPAIRAAANATLGEPMVNELLGLPGGMAEAKAECPHCGIELGEDGVCGGDRCEAKDAGLCPDCHRPMRSSPVDGLDLLVGDVAKDMADQLDEALRVMGDESTEKGMDLIASVRDELRIGASR